MTLTSDRLLIRLWTHNDTPYLTHIGELCSVFEEYFGEKLSCCKEVWLYLAPLQLQPYINQTTWYVTPLCEQWNEVQLRWKRNWIPRCHQDSRADSRLVPSQWETSLQSNAISHWLGTDRFQSHYNTVNLLQNTYNKHLIAGPHGWAMGCLLWFQDLIYNLAHSYILPPKYFSLFYFHFHHLNSFKVDLSTWYSNSHRCDPYSF